MELQAAQAAALVLNLRSSAASEQMQFIYVWDFVRMAKLAARNGGGNVLIMENAPTDAQLESADLGLECADGDADERAQGGSGTGGSARARALDGDESEDDGLEGDNVRTAQL